MGSSLKMPVQEAINNYVNAIKLVLSETSKNTCLILETGAGEGNEICTLIPDLGEMYSMFTLTEKELGFYDNEGNYLVEPGTFKIMVGGSSDAGLTSDFELK